MEKKLLGLVLIFAGIAGMMYSGYLFINGNGGSNNITQVIIYLVSGSILFFSGINFTVPHSNPVRKSSLQTNLSQVSKDS